MTFRRTDRVRIKAEHAEFLKGTFGVNPDQTYVIVGTREEDGKTFLYLDAIVPGLSDRFFYNADDQFTLSEAEG